MSMFLNWPRLLVCKLDQIRVLARHHCISIRTGFHMKRTLYPARNKGEGITRGLEDITFFISLLPESHLSLVVQLRNILRAGEHNIS